MEVIQAGPNRIRFPNSTCLKLFTNYSYIYWVGCVCKAGIVELPLTIHRLIIYRYDVESKDCRLIMQWEPYSSCKYWSFHIWPGDTDLFVFQHQHEVSIHKICLMEPEPEAILMENCTWLGSEPWLRGMSVTVAIYRFDRFHHLVVCQKRATNVCIVYGVMTGHRKHGAVWSSCIPDTYTLVRMHTPYYYHKGWSVDALGKDRHGRLHAVRWGWQMQPTSAVNTGQRSNILFATKLLSDADGSLELWLPHKRIPSSKHVPLNESFECSICFHHPASYKELLNTRLWVRPCECLGYCHQECTDSWVLYAKDNDYHWRFDMNNWSRIWSKDSWNKFRCSDCFHPYTYTIGPLRPMHQIIQATKDLPSQLEFSYQIVLVVLLLFTLLQAQYPVIQSLAMTFAKAVAAHFLNIMQGFGQSHWMLQHAIRFIDAGLLVYAVMDQIEFVFPAWCLLVLMTIPVRYQVALLVITEIVILAPHLLAIHRVRFVDYDDNNPTPIRRSQSLTNLHICQ